MPFHSDDHPMLLDIPADPAWVMYTPNSQLMHIDCDPCLLPVSMGSFGHSASLSPDSSAGSSSPLGSLSTSDSASKELNPLWLHQEAFLSAPSASSSHLLKLPLADQDVCFATHSMYQFDHTEHVPIQTSISTPASSVIKRRGGRVKQYYVCMNPHCKTTTNDTRTKFRCVRMKDQAIRLCNACGIYWRNHRDYRPEELCNAMQGKHRLRQVPVEMRKCSLCCVGKTSVWRYVGDTLVCNTCACKFKRDIEKGGFY